MSLYGQLIKQEADYTTLVDEKIAECDKLIQVIFEFVYFIRVKTTNKSGPSRKVIFKMSLRCCYKWKKWPEL